MEAAILVVDLVLLAVIYVGAIEMFVHLGIARKEASWWYLEAFCRGLGRILGDPPDDDHNQQDDTSYA